MGIIRHWCLITIAKVTSLLGLMISDRLPQILTDCSLSCYYFEVKCGQINHGIEVWAKPKHFAVPEFEYHSRLLEKLDMASV